MNNDITKKAIFCVIIIVYLLTAVFSNGYHHPDEHFQLVEFAGLKLGWNNVTDLTWEYGAKIRPALQPTIAYGVLGVLHAVGVDSPYSQALALRLLSAALALCCIYYFIRNFAHTVSPKYRIAYILLSFLLWFLPAINVRFSSETWAGMLFLLGLALAFGQKTLSLKRCMIAGVVLGLSFECRYQMALAIVGLIAWLLWVARWHWKQWMALAVGGILAIMVCTVIDRWFYGTWVFVPYLYFQVNIVQDAASSFGVLPANYYLEQILYRPTFLIGLCVFFSFCCMLLYDKKNPVLWCIIPFIFVHSLIPHKELRFLFPMVNLVPLLLIKGYELGCRLVNHQVVRRVFVISFLAVNTGGLIMLIAKPAGIGNANMMQYVIKEYADTNMAIYASLLGNPCMESSFLPIHFYEDSRIRWNDYMEKEKNILLSESVDEESCVIAVMAVEKGKRQFLLRHGFVEGYKSIPSWVEFMNRFYKVYDPGRTLILYKRRG